jgi:hypothetical protein
VRPTPGASLHRLDHALATLNTESVMIAAAPRSQLKLKTRRTRVKAVWGQQLPVLLARQLARMWLVVLGAYRDVEIGREHPLATTLGK